MAETIQVLARKSFGFKNPDRTLITKEYEPGVDIGRKGVTSKLEEALFIIQAGQINQVVLAPAWIKTDPMFAWAVSDGDLVEVNVATGRAGTAQAQARVQESDRERLAREQATAEIMAEKKKELDVMSKADLIDHGKDNYDLSLNPAMRKEELQEAILKAHQEQQEPGPQAVPQSQLLRDAQIRKAQDGQAQQARPLSAQDDRGQMTGQPGRATTQEERGQAAPQQAAPVVDPKDGPRK